VSKLGWPLFEVLRTPHDSINSPVTGAPDWGRGILCVVSSRPSGKSAPLWGVTSASEAVWPWSPRDEGPAWT
jgi:hypothetical protein